MYNPPYNKDNCVRLFIFVDIWYCCAACEMNEADDDHVLQHSQQLLFELLVLAVNHDYVREGRLILGIEKQL